MVRLIYQTSETIGSNASTRYKFFIEGMQDITTFNPENGGPNDEINEAVTIPITILNTANRDRAGLLPRGVVVRWTEITPPGFKDNGTSFIPILTERRYRQYKIGDMVSYIGGRGMIVSKIPEAIRS